MKSMPSCLLVFPNQLFEDHPGLRLKPDRVVLIEDSLFFGDKKYPLNFHRKKLVFHRSAMKQYEAFCRKLGFETTYLEHEEREDSLLKHLQFIQSNLLTGSIRLISLDAVDYELNRRLKKHVGELGMRISFLSNPGFINSREENQEFFAERNSWRMIDFYKWQRTRLDVLMNAGSPLGGKWSFDQDNRKKVPRRLIDKIPQDTLLTEGNWDLQACEHITNRYPDNPGLLSGGMYPTNHKQAADWLDSFLEQRFHHFGTYEDAIVKGRNTLWHSVLSPLLNTGLLTPDQVLSRCLDYADEHEIPLNSLEGFVRQLIGWREFVRASYEELGSSMRNANYWEHYREIPQAFYRLETGIPPVDDCLRRIEETAYCHHIERLMVLGGFLFLCEVLPNQIYRWFMEMFIDSYDWVMVPNVFSMSQHADGGLITTKPYFSGSSYIRRMSNYPKEDWCTTYDGLYWRWIWKNRKRLVQNPRWSMMCKLAEKMDRKKMETHLQRAEEYLSMIF